MTGLLKFMIQKKGSDGVNSYKLVIEKISNLNPNAIILADMDCAIIGIAINHTGEVVLVYSYAKIIDFLVSRQEITYDEANEWFDYNINIGNHENYPIFVY